MTNLTRGSGLELEQPSPLSVQQVQSAIRSVPELQIYEKNFGDAVICQSLPISNAELKEDMGISNSEHRDKIQQVINQLINYESQNILPLSEVSGRLCSDGVKELESRRNLDMMSRSQSYSSMSCSTISSEMSVDVEYRKKTLILTVQQKRPVAEWIIMNYWEKNIPALKGCVSISQHWSKENAFIVTYENEQIASDRYFKGVNYILTIEEQHSRAKENKLMAEWKLEYTIARNRGRRPSKNFHVRYRALCEQRVTVGKKKLDHVKKLKKGDVVLINQEKSGADQFGKKLRKVRIFDHEKKVDLGWVELHSADGKPFLERLD